MGLKPHQKPGEWFILDRNLVSDLRDQPVFICGHPKSGTSLVQGILDDHPELIVYPEESHFFRRFLPKTTWLTKADQLQLAEDLLLHIFTWNQKDQPPSQQGYPDRDYSELSFQLIKEKMWTISENHGIRHEGDILAAVILAFGIVSKQLDEKVKHWVEKTPYNELHVDRILSYWPKAKLIHIIRDPRDNYLSYKRKHPEWSPEFFADNWTRFAFVGIRHQENLGDEQYFIIRYEDLVQSPRSVGEKLSDFLSIRFNESMLQPTRIGKHWAGNSMFSRRFDGVSADPVGRWQKMLSSQAVKVLEAKAGDVMEMFDYSRDLSPDMRTWLRVWTWPLRKRIRRLLFR